MQHGGIITRPTLARLGEAGPEMVLPLNRKPIINNMIKVYIGDREVADLVLDHLTTEVALQGGL